MCRTREQRALPTAPGASRCGSAANTLLPHIKDGKLRLLAHGAARFPNWATYRPSPKPACRLLSSIHGLAIHAARVSSDIISKVNAEVVRILTPRIKMRLASQGIEIVTARGRICALHPRRQRKWGKLIRRRTSMENERR